MQVANEQRRRFNRNAKPATKKVHFDLNLELYKKLKAASPVLEKPMIGIIEESLTDYLQKVGA